MNLNDEGIAISIKKFSDSTNLMKILTKDNGVYSGLIRLKRNQGNSGVNIPGNTLSINSGTTLCCCFVFTIEILICPTSPLMPGPASVQVVPDV